MIILFQLSSLKNQDLIRVDDSVKSMSNGDDCGALEGIVHGRVDGVLSLNINVGCSLINQNNLGRFENSSSNRN